MIRIRSWSNSDIKSEFLLYDFFMFTPYVSLISRSGRASDLNLLPHKLGGSKLPICKVGCLTKGYDRSILPASNESSNARSGIDADVQQFYRTKYPDVHASQKALILAAIADLQHIYQSTIFPYMKVDWRTHTNNIGHLYTPGCFRCHAGQHVSTDGKVIPKDCTTCHTVLAQLILRKSPAAIATMAG